MSAFEADVSFIKINAKVFLKTTPHLSMSPRISTMDTAFVLLAYFYNGSDMI